MLSAKGCYRAQRVPDVVHALADGPGKGSAWLGESKPSCDVREEAFHVKAVIALVALAALGLTAPVAWAATAAENICEQLRQNMALVKAAERDGNRDVMCVLLREARRKAERAVKDVDPDSVCFWLTLAKVSWYCGDQGKVTAEAGRVRELADPRRDKEAVSEADWLQANPHANPLDCALEPDNGGGPPAPPPEDPYDVLFREATEAQTAGRLDEARAKYMAAHELKADGRHEPAIRSALSALTIAEATGRAEAKQWGEVWRLVEDFFRAFPWDEPPVEQTQEATWLAVNATQALERPDDTLLWATRYVDRFCTASPERCKTIQEEILGQVNQARYERSIDTTRTLLQAGSREALDKAKALLEDAKKLEPAGRADTVYLEGVYYVVAPEREYGKARERFRQYLAQAPNGRFVREAYGELRWLDEPLLLFAAPTKGARRDELTLWTMRSDGSDPRQVTHSDQGYLKTTPDGAPVAAVSPSGKSLAYVTRSPATGVRLFVSKPDGREAPKEVWSSRGPDDYVGGLAWAPRTDAELLKFHAQQGGGEVYIWYWYSGREAATRIEGSSTSVDHPAQLASEWSPDGKLLGWKDDESTLSISQLMGEERTTRLDFGEVKQQKFDSPVVRFVWTQPTLEGSRPVVMGCTPSSVFKVDLGASGITSAEVEGELLGFFKSPREAVWQVIPTGKIADIGCSSDGDSVAFLVGDTLAIYTINTDPTPQKGPATIRPMRFVREIPNVNAFAFSPLGARMAYRTSEGVFISRFDAIPTNDKKVGGSRRDTPFFWSQRNGQLLTAEADRLTITYDREPLSQSYKPNGDMPADQWLDPQWSPDDSMVAMQKVSGTSAEVVISARQATTSTQEWLNLHPPAVEPGALRLVGWLGWLGQ
jgi:hypothetical protein